MIDYFDVYPISQLIYFFINRKLYIVAEGYFNNEWHMSDYNSPLKGFI